MEEIVTNMEKFENVTELINYYILINSEVELQNKFDSEFLDTETLYTNILQNLKVRYSLYKTK